MDKECIAGACSGLAQNIVGHPFDTAKVFIQNNMSLWNMKPLQYYRGFSFPTIYSIVSHSILFPVNQFVYNRTNNYYYSGFFAGITVSPLCYVFEYLKVKRQTCMGEGLGGLGGLRRPAYMYGFPMTFVRESIAYSGWFGSYFTLTEKYSLSSFYSGGIAGIIAWTISYPFDVIRNRQLAQNIDIQKAYRQGALWKGYTICIIRAAIVNSVGFAVYDYFI